MRDIGLAFFIVGLAMIAHSLFFFDVDLVLGLFENPLQIAEKQKIFRVGLAVYAIGFLILFRTYLTKRNVGLTLSVAGGALCIYALLLFETTVSVYSGGWMPETVNNLGLLNDRTNMIITSGIMILAGLFLWKD
jgi:hypothetical protein